MTEAQLRQKHWDDAKKTHQELGGHREFNPTVFLERFKSFGHSAAQFENCSCHPHIFQTKKPE